MPSPCFCGSETVTRKVDVIFGASSVAIHHFGAELRSPEKW